MLSEYEFLLALIADPGEPVRWLLWADWLEENGAAAQAEVIRLRSVLTRSLDLPDRQEKETRLQELIYEVGVEPPVVTRSTNRGMVLHLIPPGRFWMGSPESEIGRREDETQVAVTLSQPFWVGKYLVTLQQYDDVTARRPNFNQSDPQNPVEEVSYIDALDFCRRMTQQEHLAGTIPINWEFSLPTEAQWEYACRSGSSTAYSYGNDVHQLEEYAWFVENSDRDSHPVGLKRGNGWGLHDMHGNVAEWCRDWYANDLAGAIDPIGPKQGTRRVYRGGNYFHYSASARSAHRNQGRPNLQDSLIGFRVVLVPIPAKSSS